MLTLSVRKFVPMVFIAALVLRILLFSAFLGQPLSIIDEQHYNTIALCLVEHGVYGMAHQRPSAMRPPAYPFFVAGVYKLTGSTDPDSVRLLQVLISLLSGALLFKIFSGMFGPRAAAAGLILFLFYPSLLFFNFFILTETLHIFLFLLFFLFLSNFLKTGRPLFASMAGLLLGLASLTRSITYPMAVPIVVLTALLTFREYRQKALVSALLFLLFFCAAIAPWTARNHRLFDALVPVGTMGGLNLYMGNYEHTLLHRAWATVDIKGEKAWHSGHEGELKGLNEAEKQIWAIDMAKEYMKGNPGITVIRTFVKAANLWGLERTVIAGVERNYFQRLAGSPLRYPIYAVVLFAYVAIVWSGFSGLIFRLMTRREAFDILFFFILVSFTGLHAIVFGHPRYHLSLMPLLCAYAGWSISNRRDFMVSHRKLFRAVHLLVLAVFSVIWGYELIIGSHDRIMAMMG